MDITIDCGQLFFGLNNVRRLEDNMVLLQNALNKITVSSELPSANTFSDVKRSLKSVLDNDIDDLIVRLDNTKRILSEFDQEAAYLFNFYEEGIINGDFEFTDMPLMDQTDYNNIAYSQGTISTSGCGLTSVCMVASYLTGNLYTPAELVGATRGYGDNVSRMLAAAKSLGLVWHNDPGTSHQDLLNYLEQGNIAIVLVRNSSHFVVVKGVTEDGKVLVNDPYGPRVKDYPLSLNELEYTAGNTWIFNPNENQHVKQELDDTITVGGSTAEQIINESGFVDRTDRGEVPDDPYANPEPEVSLRQETPSTQQSAVSTPPASNNNNNSGTSTPPASNNNNNSGTSTPPASNNNNNTGTSTPPASNNNNNTGTSTPPASNNNNNTGTSTPPASNNNNNTGTSTPPASNNNNNTGTSTPPASNNNNNTGTSTPPASNNNNNSGTSTPPASNNKPEISEPVQAPSGPVVSTPNYPSTTVPSVPSGLPSKLPENTIDDSLYDDEIIDSTNDIENDSLYDDINNDAELEYDDSYDELDDYDTEEDVQYITSSNNNVETDSNVNNLLIPGLAVAAGAAALGGAAYVAKKKKESEEDENNEESYDSYDDKF